MRHMKFMFQSFTSNQPEALFFIFGEQKKVKNVFIKKVKMASLRAQSHKCLNLFIF